MMRRLSAFSLIEIAITLIIFGIIAGLSIPLLTTNQRLSQQQTTRTHRDQIIAALASYVLQHHKLPVPLKTVGSEIHPHCNDANGCTGIVPYKILGLSERTAKDGYGHWFTFVIHPALSKTVPPSQSRGAPFCAIQQNLISVRNSATNQAVIEPQGDPIAFVLISHGKEGRGTLTDNGQRLASQGLESQNTQEDFNFWEGHVLGFDHQTYWTTRNNFMAYHAKSPCSAPSRNEPSSTRQSGTLS